MSQLRAGLRQGAQETTLHRQGHQGCPLQFGGALWEQFHVDFLSALHQAQALG